jgi:hypothetical protein
MRSFSARGSNVAKCYIHYIRNHSKTFHICFYRHSYFCRHLSKSNPRAYLIMSRTNRYIAADISQLIAFLKALKGTKTDALSVCIFAFHGIQQIMCALNALKGNNRCFKGRTTAPCRAPVQRSQDPCRAPVPGSQDPFRAATMQGSQDPCRVPVQGSQDPCRAFVQGSQYPCRAPVQGSQDPCRAPVQTPRFYALARNTLKYKCFRKLCFRAWFVLPQYPNTLAWQNASQRADTEDVLKLTVSWFCVKCAREKQCLTSQA